MEQKTFNRLVSMGRKPPNGYQALDLSLTLNGSCYPLPSPLTDPK